MRSFDRDSRGSYPTAEVIALAQVSVSALPPRSRLLFSTLLFALTGQALD